MTSRLRLPDQVLQRLGAAGLKAITARAGGDTVETRSWSTVEMRAGSDSGTRIVGYASTYDQPYPIWGGPEAGGFNETVKPGAFSKSVAEKDDVRLLVNHEGVPLARTKSGTMTLAADDIGLLVDAGIDPTSPLAAGLQSAMTRGDMDQMSFAFEVTRQVWSPDYSERGILEVKLYDVSVVTYPANDQTLALIAADRPAAPPLVITGRSVRLAMADWARRPAA